MPSQSDVFAQLAKGLRDNGAEFAPHALDLMSTAASFLVATGHAADGEIAAASYLATLLKSDDAKRAAVALSISPDLIPSLSPSPVGMYLQLAQILARSEEPQASVAATVLFAWYAKLAREGRDGEADGYRNAAWSATLEGSKNSSLALTLYEEMGKVPYSAAPKRASGGYLFSISLDLVGSTDAKTRVMNLAGGDIGKIDELNRQVYINFCEIEKLFYKYAAAHYGTSLPIDPVKFFTVKGIGDEIWILCDSASEDVPSVGHRLIETAIEIASHSVRFLATENTDGGSFDRSFNYGKIEPILSPIKIFIDILSHASSVDRVRDQQLMSALPELLKDYHRRDPTPEEIAITARRICLSGYEPVGWWTYHQYRTDFIGHEIDRFFRTTKSAIPGTVVIGESMAKSMKLSFNAVTDVIDAVLNADDVPLMGGVPSDPIHTRTRTFKPGDLKGIGYGYSTHALFAPRTLKRLYVQMEADKRNNIPALPYDETAKLIPPDTVDELAKRIATPL
jgi:hypothetical protein